MSDVPVDREMFLEAGLAIFGALLLAAIGVLIAGRVGGGAERARRHAQPAPGRGSVTPERHRNIGTVASR